MKAFLTIVLIQFTVLLYSQNWASFNKNYRYNYSLENESYTTVVVFADSVLTQGTDTIYSLNRIAAKCDSCFFYYPEVGVANSNYVLINQPQFMQRRIIYSNNQYRLSDTSNYIIPRFSNVGNTWMFNASRGITAQVITMVLKINFGVNDSIRTILLSTNDTIILSKQFGILKYPAKFGQSIYYKLRGIENKSSYDVYSLYGEKVPNYFDFFKLESGVIHYYSMTSSYSGQPGAHCDAYYYAKKSIVTSALSGTVISNSYIEDRKGCTGNCASDMWGGCIISNPYTFSSLPVYSYTYNSVAPNIINMFNDNIYNSYNNKFYSPSGGSTQYYFLLKFGKTINNKFYKSYGYSCFSGYLGEKKINYSGNIYLPSSQNPNVYYASNYNGINTFGETFIQDYGQVNAFFPGFESQDYYCTSGIIDGADTLGNLNALGVLLNIDNQENTYSSYGPNPTKDIIKINLPFESTDNTGTIEVKDVFGKPVFQKIISIGTNSEIINLQNLAHGLYFVEVKMPHFHRLFKVVKE